MMDEQRERGADTSAESEAPTTAEENEALQQAQRRAAATREELPAAEQVFDSANESGMGERGANSSHYRGQGRDTPGAFGEEDEPVDRPQ